jgi:phosphate-selective porin OprO/OprP
MKRLFFWLFLLPILLLAEPKGYPPLFQNDANVSNYDWNAIDSKWINTRALLMAAFDSTYYKDNDTLPQLQHYTKADVRGIRVGAGGTLNFQKPWLYLVSGSINSLAKDFDSSTMDSVTLYDAVVEIPLHGKYGRVEVGRMKEPVSMERLMGMVFEQVMERPMHLDTFTTTRNDGISYSNLLFNEKVTLRSGFFKDKNFVWASRITAIALEDDINNQLIHLGFSYRYEELEDKTINFDVNPEQYFIEPILDTGDIAATKDDTFNLEFTYLKGPLWIAAEYTGKYIHAIEQSNPYFYGFHTSLSYFVTGEERGYNKKRGIVRRIRPIVDFHKGGWGALEFAYRYSYINISDKEIDGGKMDIHSVGGIWHATYGTQVHLQYTHAQPVVSTIDDVQSLDSIQLRLVIVID